MSSIHFDAIVGADQVIRPPAGMYLPHGEITVVVTPHAMAANATKSRPGPGLFKGAITYMAPDFEAPLEDMKEYME